MGGLNLMNGDRYIDPQFKGSRLVPTAKSPLVDAGRPAPMKKDLNGVRVGVDGNGDGRRGADIGAYEAKSKGHKGGKGKDGKGKGGKGGKGHHGAHNGGNGGKGHHGPHWNGARNERLTHRT